MNRIPPPPPGFDKRNFFEGIYWHQTWQIFQGIWTPGVNQIMDVIINLDLAPDLTGKRVLDIGAWNGCLSFECERRGAREVIALGPEEPAGTGFYRIRDALGSKRTHYVRGSVYDLDPKKLGYFDIVLFCGVLYHLRYPLLGIDNVRRICCGEVFVETFLIDEHIVLGENGQTSHVPLRQLSPALVSQPMWQFYRRDELDQDPSNWSGPNAAAVIQAFGSAGFDMRLVKAWGNRGAFHGRVRKELPEFLGPTSGEGAYYNVVVKNLFDGAEREQWADFPR
jgi:tRNA (mo5U34)-methyltransferase